MGKSKLLLIISILAVLLIVVVFLLTFTNISFSETFGRVVDSNGAPIAGAKVLIGYSCVISSIAPHPETRSYGEARAITNANGEFSVSPLVVGWKFHNTNCHKSIVTFKEGYCGVIERCSNEIKNGRSFSAGQLSKGEDLFYFLNRNGVYYESASFDAGKDLTSEETAVTFVLNKLDGW